MNRSLMVHYAVACLEALDFPMPPRDLSRAQSIPIEDCLHILRQFESAGLVRENAGGSFERLCSIERLTALDVLQALWSVPTGKDVRMLYATNGSESDQMTRFAVRTGFWPRG